jgi:hypothetical protein
MKIDGSVHTFGVLDATTRSLDKAIMAPSLKTASNTISKVGKYCTETSTALCTVQVPKVNRNFTDLQLSWDRNSIRNSYKNAGVSV